MGTCCPFKRISSLLQSCAANWAGKQLWLGSRAELVGGQLMLHKEYQADGIKEGAWGLCAFARAQSF